MPAVVPQGELVYGMQLPVQTLTESIREPWEVEATVEDLVEVTQRCEATGHWFVGVCDHVAIPRNDYTARMGTTWYDPVATLAFLAAATSSVRLLTTVYVISYRHPLATAKAFATLDRLSGGRVIVGVGAGHVEAEFETLGVPFAERGARTNEAIDAFRATFAAEHTSFAGAFYEWEDMAISPRPVQDEIPIWIGGSSGPALRRVGERGDGWIPQGTPRDAMPDALATIRSRRDEVRPGAGLDLGWWPGYLYVGDPPAAIADHPYPPIAGSGEQVAESLRHAHELGVNVLHLHFRSRSKDELLDQLDAFAADVAPHL